MPAGRSGGSFFGGAADRLFLGAFAEVSEAKLLAEYGQRVRDQYRLKGKLQTSDRLHVTLQHFGDGRGLPPELIAGVTAIGRGVEMAPFLVEFDRVRTFGRGAFAFTGGDGATGLHLLQQRIAAALRKVGLGQIVDDSYTPHMTILHDSRRIAEHPINPIRWWVREFVLVHSHLGQTRYDFLARFPLR